LRPAQVVIPARCKDFDRTESSLFSCRVQPWGVLSRAIQFSDPRPSDRLFPPLAKGGAKGDFSDAALQEIPHPLFTKGGLDNTLSSVRELNSPGYSLAPDRTSHGSQGPRGQRAVQRRIGGRLTALGEKMVPCSGAFWSSAVAKSFALKMLELDGQRLRALKEVLT
jgi:hypothetical protein